MRKKQSESLLRLRKLTQELTDRDDQMKRDFRMFEDFFVNFPLPVTMWSITKDHTVVSQRGNGFACHEATDLETLFLCPTVKAASLEKHEHALKGNRVEYFIDTEDKTYYAILVPRVNDEDAVSGVSGIAWDITSNTVMLDCLEQIKELTEGRRGQYKELHNIASHALGVSKIRNLMNREGDE